MEKAPNPNYSPENQTEQPNGTTKKQATTKKETTDKPEGSDEGNSGAACNDSQMASGLLTSLLLIWCRMT